MRGAFVALLIGIAFLVYVYFHFNIYRSKSYFDIHLHDTYFILNYASAIIHALLFLGTLLSIGGMIGTHFKSKLFLTLVVIILSVDIFYMVSFYKAFNSTETVSFPKE